MSNSAAFFNAQEELKQFGLWLEDFETWLGEKPPYKYIVLFRSTHVAYGNSIAEVRKALARQGRLSESKKPAYQLSLLD